MCFKTHCQYKIKRWRLENIQQDVRKEICFKVSRAALLKSEVQRNSFELCQIILLLKIFATYFFLF